MATSAEIGASDNYTGNANLGGASAPVFNIDSKPLELLSQYTFHYNKSVWDQKQAETNAKVKQLADLSNIHLNDLRGRDKEQASKEFNELLNYASDYARKTPKNNEEKLQQELEWQTKLGAFNNNFDSGKNRAVSYYAHLNTIKQNIPDATTQDEAIKQLNKTFDDTTIDTPISAVPNFKIEKFGIPDPTQQKFTSVAIMGNDNLKMKNGIYNPRINGGIADASIFAIAKAYPKQGTSEYDSLSDNEKAQADIQRTVTSDSKGLVDSANILNKAMQPYIKDGKFDVDSFENDNASNTTLMNAYNGVKKFNEGMHDSYNQAINGYFSNKGINIPLPPNINPNDFKYGFVDFAKGVTPNNLVQSGMYAKYTGDTFEADIQHTGEKNDLIKANITAATTRRGQDLDYGAAMKRINAETDKWKASQTGSTTQINGAMTRAKRIYADMMKLADSKGVISPEKIRQLNVEQLKYLGIEVPQQRDAEGKITDQGGFKPLNFEPETEYAIQLSNNGEVKVLRPKEGEKKLVRLADGRFNGLFEPTKSTNIYNIGTNILNEELKNAGTKELNSYYGVDVTGNETKQTEGGTQSASGSTKLTQAQKFLQGLK